MRLSKAILFCCWLLIAITVNAQSRSGRCQVTMSWYDPKQKLGSGVMQLGTFNPSVADVTTFKSFKSEGGVIVTVGVQYETLSEARFQEVLLMITASNKEAKK